VFPHDRTHRHQPPLKRHQPHLQGIKLIFSGTSLIFSGTSLIFSGTSLSQSGARCQPVLRRSLDPWSSPDVSTFDGHVVTPASNENHICHFHIFIRNTEISL
jgi:hypothetical protein